MTHRRIHASAAAAVTGGGLLTAAFLQAAIAAADSGSDNADTFTIGHLTFSDPTAMPGYMGGDLTSGFEHISPLFATAPVMSIGYDSLLGLISTGSQRFDIADGGTALGTVDMSTNLQNLMGIETAQFTVTSTHDDSGLSSAQAAELPADGTVYSITKIGDGFYNIYEAAPNAAGTAAAHATDTVVTPLGNFTLPTTWDAIAKLNPATALDTLGNTSGDTSLSSNAFTIDGTTFDPGKGGISVASLPVANFGPLMTFEASNLNITGGGRPATNQSFEVYGAHGTNEGSVQTALWYSDLLGLHNTEIIVGGVTPHGDATGLPAVGTVYSVTDLGLGVDNVYEYVPAAHGTGTATITDYLKTPFGNITIPTTFDAAALNPAAPLAALETASGISGLSDNAFTLDGTTFDPGTAGFSTVTPLFGVAPLLEIGGISFMGHMLTEQNLEAYHGDTNLGSVTVGEGLSNILGIDTTQFTVVSTTEASGLTTAEAAELPKDGTVYSVTDFAKGWTNVYEAIPNADDTAASHISDTLITPFGDINLSSMFDAIAPLSAGDVVSGLDDASPTGFDLFDPSTW